MRVKCINDVATIQNQNMKTLNVYSLKGFRPVIRVGEKVIIQLMIPMIFPNLGERLINLLVWSNHFRGWLIVNTHVFHHSLRHKFLLITHIIMIYRHRSSRVIRIVCHLWYVFRYSRIPKSRLTHKIQYIIGYAPI